MKWQNIIDIDRCDGLPNALLRHLWTYHPTGIFRFSSSGNGYHIMSKDPRCAICESFSDDKYTRMRDRGKGIVLFSKKGSKKAGQWQPIRSQLYVTRQ